MEQGDTANPTSQAVLEYSQSVGRLGESCPGQRKSLRESPVLWVFCNPLDHFSPSSVGTFAKGAGLIPHVTVPACPSSARLGKGTE